MWTLCSPRVSSILNSSKLLLHKSQEEATSGTSSTLPYLPIRQSVPLLLGVALVTKHTVAMSQTSSVNPSPSPDSVHYRIYTKNKSNADYLTVSRAASLA